MIVQQQPFAASPSVGIFWLVPDAKGLVLVSDAVPLPAAETYGDCLTYPRGHYEVWEEWRRLSATERTRRGLPGAIALHEYEDFPRGRIIYELPTKRFTMYADRKFFKTPFVTKLVERFGLDSERRVLRGDQHYVT